MIHVKKKILKMAMSPLGLYRSCRFPVFIILINSINPSLQGHHQWGEAELGLVLAEAYQNLSWAGAHVWMGL